MFSFLRSRRRSAKAPEHPPAIPAGTRVYAIGDIHGCFDLYQKLLSQIEADNAARAPAKVVVILLGDLVDRGPNSKEVVAAAMVKPAFADDHVVLRGNHEEIFLDAFTDSARVLDVWSQVGGQATLASYGISAQYVFKGPEALERVLRNEIPRTHIAFLSSLPINHQIGDYFFVHAGVRPGVPLDRQTERDMLWIRNSFLDSTDYHGAVIVHGHTPVEEVEDEPNRIGLDTGAYLSGVLSAVGLEGEDRWYLQTAG